MSKQNLLLNLFLAIFILSCASDDNQTTEPPIKKQKLYKKTEVTNNGIIVATNEVFYNQNSKIESMIRDEISYMIRTFSIAYSSDDVSDIVRISDFDNSAIPDETITYNNINIQSTSIILIAENDDKTLEIHHSNGYVDSTKLYDTSAPNNVFEQSFSRNSDNNLISNITGGDQFTYSDFDSEKKIDPYGSVTEYEHGDFFLIFNLKVTANNPLTGTYLMNGSTGSYNSYLEYDNEGFVIKTSSEPNATDDFVIHQYIEQ